MSLTLNELMERLLKRYDADDLLEALGVTAEDLLERFDDRVIRHYDKLTKEFDDEAEEQLNEHQ